MLREVTLVMTGGLGVAANGKETMYHEHHKTKKAGEDENSVTV